MATTTTAAPTTTTMAPTTTTLAPMMQPNGVWDVALLDAIWTRIGTDATFYPLVSGGKLFRFSQNDLLGRMEVTAAICPVLAIAPAPSGHAWRPALRRRGADQGHAFALLAEIATSGPDRGAIVSLAGAFEEFLERNMESDRFGIQDLLDIEFRDVSYRARPGPEFTVLFWMFSVVCACSRRVH